VGSTPTSFTPGTTNSRTAHPCLSIVLWYVTLSMRRFFCQPPILCTEYSRVQTPTLTLTNPNPNPNPKRSEVRRVVGLRRSTEFDNVRHCRRSGRRRPTRQLSYSRHGGMFRCENPIGGFSATMETFFGLNTFSRRDLEALWWTDNFIVGRRKVPRN
jgi:hypothetical protein